MQIDCGRYMWLRIGKWDLIYEIGCDGCDEGRLGEAAGRRHFINCKASDLAFVTGKFGLEAEALFDPSNTKWKLTRRISQQI